MTTKQLKDAYYIEKTYEKVSEIEFNCKLIIKRKSDNKIITGLKTRINISEVEQNITDSQFEINPTSWETYLDAIIIMQFNLLMLKINLTNVEDTQGKKNIADFFEENPFYEN